MLSRALAAGSTKILRIAYGPLLGDGSVVHLEVVASVSAGDVVAEKYRVERLLGRGGMGYVVAARHLTLDQLVAIKFLRKSALNDEEALARFRREAKACVRLKNEHVAKVFDVGVYGEEPFIVMEHLEGADLGAMTRGDNKDSKVGRALAIAESCDFIIQACEALAEAHSLGIVHRDIKLPNLFLTRSASGQGLLKVLDFGVSKTIAEQGDVTQTAAVLGSPKYMSPEQMNDPRHVDGRTDIWSLGVCLYRLMSGHAPFDGDTIGRLCTMVLHETPIPLRDLRSDVPPMLEAAINACMQKNREFRFANVAELAAALVPFAPQPEHAAERAQHIATVLGLNELPPIGYLPPPPPAAPPQQQAMFMMTTGQSLEGPAAWAHTMVEQRRDKKKSEMMLAIAACAFLFGMLVIGFAVFARDRHPSSATSASAPPSVATVVAPPPTSAAPPPTAASAQPATPTTAALAVSPTATSTATALAQRKTHAGGGNGGGGGGQQTHSAASAKPHDDGALTIPGDRK